MKATDLYYTGCEENYQPHFLDACFLCQRSLCNNNDIFMYRGDTPFCSQECRQEQIEIDEANERRWNHSSKRSLKNNETTKESNTNTPVRTGTVVVA